MKRRDLVGGALFALWLVSVLTEHRSAGAPVWSYVGPGAGFAFLGSFLSLLAGFVLGLFSILTWPLRMAWQSIRRRQGFRNARVKKVIFLGLFLARVPSSNFTCLLIM